MASEPQCAGVESAPARLGASVETRLAFLRSGFNRESGHIHLWSFIWGAIYGCVAIIQFVWAAADPKSPAHATLIFGCIAAAVGTLSTLIAPLKMTLPMTRLKWTMPDRCELLRRSEDALARVAQDQRFIKGPAGHLGNLLFNLGLLLTLGIAFGQWQTGFIASGIGLVIGEINVRTQPSGALTLTRRYRAAELSPTPSAPLFPPRPALGATP